MSDLSQVACWIIIVPILAERLAYRAILAAFSGLIDHKIVPASSFIPWVIRNRNNHISPCIELAVNRFEELRDFFWRKVSAIFY
jgi:hypothetical protein